MNPNSDYEQELWDRFAVAAMSAMIVAGSLHPCGLAEPYAYATAMLGQRRQMLANGTAPGTGAGGLPGALGQRLSEIEQKVRKARSVDAAEAILEAEVNAMMREARGRKEGTADPLATLRARLQRQFAPRKAKVVHVKKRRRAGGKA